MRKQILCATQRPPDTHAPRDTAHTHTHTAPREASAVYALMDMAKVVASVAGGASPTALRRRQARRARPRLGRGSRLLGRLHCIRTPCLGLRPPPNSAALRGRKRTKSAVCSFTLQGTRRAQRHGLRRNGLLWCSSAPPWWHASPACRGRRWSSFHLLSATPPAPRTPQLTGDGPPVAGEPQDLLSVLALPLQARAMGLARRWGATRPAPSARFRRHMECFS